jgi:hypothetical protein
MHEDNRLNNGKALDVLSNDINNLRESRAEGAGKVTQAQMIAASNKAHIGIVFGAVGALAAAVSLILMLLKAVGK